MAKLDKFYTKPEVARQCYETLLGVLPTLGVNPLTAFFVEPSAGAGDFYDLLPADRRVGYDIAPEHPGIIERDFFSVFLDEYDYDSKDVVVIGNPPFGFHSNLAIQFFNHAAWFADTIVFIVPASWERYYYQVHLDSRMHLIHSTPLDENIFYRPNGTDYKANCVFQVWHKHGDECLRKPMPITKHSDFHVRAIFCHHNRYNDPEKVWLDGFDFLIFSSAYHRDFYPIFYPEKIEIEKYNYNAIKVNSDRAFGKLMMIDYNAIAYQGVGPHWHVKIQDIYTEYIRLYGR